MRHQSPLYFLIFSMLIASGCAHTKKGLASRIEDECAKDSGSDVIKSVVVDGYMYENTGVYRYMLDPLFNGHVDYIEFDNSSGYGGFIFYNPPKEDMDHWFKSENTFTEIIRVSLLSYNSSGCSEYEHPWPDRIPGSPYMLLLSLNKNALFQSTNNIGKHCLLFEATNHPKSKFVITERSNTILPGSKKGAVVMSKSEQFIKNIKTGEVIAYDRNYGVKDEGCGYSCFSSGVLAISCRDQDKYKARFKSWRSALIYSNSSGERR